MLEGWFDTEWGMEPFLLEGHGSFVEAIKEMIRYDADFGHTDMEVEWNGEDATKLAYDTVMLVLMHWAGGTLWVR